MRVFVGMSGGVDSSVAAKRLIEAGHEVVGVFIKVWQPEFIMCDWEKERLDAMRVAAHLGIPFLTMNAEEAYKREVADYMIRSYTEGHTPNPDVMCNEHVKFGAFYTWARAQGADMIATGHYAQIQEEGDAHRLIRAIDPSKDQSYFLWRISQEALDHTLFPIGDTRKVDIRSEAERACIPTATKADSQGICFLGHINMREFLGHYVDLVPGDVLDAEGTVIGTHHGALLYTEGQRHGFTVSGTPTHTPLYVHARDLAHNTITVLHAREAKTTHTITLADVHTLGNPFDGDMDAVFRYHGEPHRVHVSMGENRRATLTVQDPSSSVSAVKGQSCVLYTGNECRGGGVIV